MRELTDTELKSIAKTAEQAGIAAGKYIQSQFDQHYNKEQKIGGDSLASQVVTEVDFKAQEIILKGLKASMETYDFGLLAEEATDDDSRHQKDYFWCIDPMDGTLPFTERRSGYAVSIALISNEGDPYIGVVYIPDQEICYSTIRGKGVSQNDLSVTLDYSSTHALDFYMDQSFQSEKYYEWVKSQVKSWADERDLELVIHSSYGGVRNAIGVMLSSRGCYFKFPKVRKGCGSIWDYAATRLMCEECGIQVSNMSGKTLHLNGQGTTFMNEQGILYASDTELSDFIMQLSSQLKNLVD